MAAILLVDSDPPFRHACRAALEQRGHVVAGAGTARLAVSQLREGGIDLVIVDPEVAGGIDAVVQGLARLPDPPPFVIVTGAADGPMLSARLGAAGFLAKPCVLEELGELVSRVADAPVGAMPVPEEDAAAQGGWPQAWPRPRPSASQPVSVGQSRQQRRDDHK